MFGKLKRILPTENNEYYIVIERDNPIPIERIKDLNNTWKDEEVIITISKLIKGKNKKVKRIKLEEEVDITEESLDPLEDIEEDKEVGQTYFSPFGEVN